jgi:hypothetical protein
MYAEDDLVPLANVHALAMCKRFFAPRRATAGRKWKRARHPRLRSATHSARVLTTLQGTQRDNREAAVSPTGLGNPQVRSE